MNERRNSKWSLRSMVVGAIIGFSTTLLMGATTVIVAPQSVLQTFLHLFEVNPGQLGGDVFWMRFGPALASVYKAQCFYADLTKRKDGPKPTHWETAGDFVFSTWAYHDVKGNIRMGNASNKDFCETPIYVDTYAIPNVYGAADTAPILPIVVGDTTPSTIPQPVPVPVPPVVVTITAPTGTLTDATGGTWTFGAATSTGGSSLVLNGTATGGFGSLLRLVNGKIYTFTLQNTWYLWNGTNWVIQATAPVSSS